MSRTPLALVAVLLVVATAVAGTAGARVDAGGGQDAPAGDGVQATGEIDADSVRMTVALAPDGTARWTVAYRVRLDDENETAAFESLREDVESDPENVTDRFARRIAATVRAAENATGREMRLRNVTVSAHTQELAQTYGVLEYGFEWTNFSTVEDGTIRAGDAIEGIFLDESTTLVFAWPEGYALQSADPQVEAGVGDDRSAGWSGPREFGADAPRVVVAPAEEPAAGDGLRGLTPVLVGAVALVALAVAGVVWYRERGATPTEDDGGPPAGAASDQPELLSNEEQVMKLVRDRGGRVRQQEVVDALGWTEAKTSQVVRTLREEGELEGFRLGRENVLRLPDDGDT